MSHPAEVDAAIICPDCRTSMERFAIAPHRMVHTMQRNIFVCPLCNRTQTYMIPAATPEDADNRDASQSPSRRGGA